MYMSYSNWHIKANRTDYFGIAFRPVMEISSAYRADRVDLIHLILYIYQKKETEKYSETLWLLTKREQWKNSLSLITITYLYPKLAIYFSVLYFINSDITSP